MRLFAIALMFAATPAAAQVVLTDREGTSTTLAAPAQEVVCITEPCLHALALLDMEPAAVWPSYYESSLGRPELFGERAADIAILPGEDGPDLEVLAALEPDLIASFPNDSEYLLPEVVERIAPVYRGSYDFMAPDLDALAHDFVQIARAVGREGEAASFVAALRNRQAAYVTRLGETPRREVLVIRLTPPDVGEIYALPCGPLMQQIATCANDTGDWVTLGVEGLLALDPEVLIVEDWGSDVGTTGPQDWADVPLWSEIPAIAADQTHYLPVLTVAPYSPLAWDLALDTLMPLLYPEAFSGPLTDQDVAAVLAQE